MNAREPLYAVWDDLVQESRPVNGFTAVVMHGAHLDIIGRTPDEHLLAVAHATGQRYLVVRTGTRRRWGWATSVRIIPAIDTGDAAGTLVFWPSEGYTGHVNAEVFA